MAKPFADRTGSGLHVHFHLADVETGESVFNDNSDTRGLGCSETGYHFVGGVLKHARALCAVTCPTVNCYKRLKLGSGLFSSRSGFTWTPAFISYGDNNRTQMIRTAGPGHFEDRTVSAGCNPYLALAVYVAAGMDGILNRIAPGDPNLANMYDRPLETVLAEGVKILPQSLPEAIAALQDDEVVKDALGVIADEFINLKKQESSSYESDVSPLSLIHI